MAETVNIPLAGIEPAARAFLEKINRVHGPPIYEMKIDKARHVLSHLQDIDVPEMPADIEDIDIPGGPTGQVSVRFVRPQHSTEALPAVVYLHGGGWVLGDRDTHDRLIREIANKADVAVAFINYTRSPEAKYPVAVEESYAAMQYIVEHGRDLNVDASRLAIAGDSVGGNMSAALALLSPQRKGPHIDYLALFYPVTDANFDTPSYRRFADGHWLSREAMKWFWDQYMPDKTARKQPIASPLRATIDQLKGFPPTLVITDELDVLRDEGEAFAYKLMEAGIETTAVRFLGTIHDFMMLNALADAPATRAAIDLTCGMLRKAFTS